MSAVVNRHLRGVLLWTLLWICSCEDVEIFNSNKQARLGWSPSDPIKAWTEISLRVGTQSPVPVLQACGKLVKRTLLSQWMERGEDAHHLLMDVSIAQEEESSDQLTPLQVHLIGSDTPVRRFRYGGTILYLNTSSPFPASAPPQLSTALSRRLALSLGPVHHKGFQLAFSYSGTCVMLTAIRIYYKTCPDILLNLVSFRRTGAGSGPQSGSCVQGAEEFSPPVRQCAEDGTWGPQEGGCTCGPGYEIMNHTCQACRLGYYRAVGGPERCRSCPPNSMTLGEGAESCQCSPGFSRLPDDPEHLGCTKAPSAPVNLTARHHNASVLLLSWDPPQDLGGRSDLTYRVRCEEEASSQWRACGGGVVFLLSNTSVSVLGLNPRRDYRLWVLAWNPMVDLQGTPHSASVSIHKWQMDPAVTPNVSRDPQQVTAAPPNSIHSLLFLTIGCVLGGLLLIVIIFTAVCVLRHKYTILDSDLETELLPISNGISYRRPPTDEQEEEQEVEQEGAAPPQSINSAGVSQLLEGLSSRLLDNLKDVLVERNQLTLGKELGKGEFGSVFEGVFSSEEAVDVRVAVKTMRVGIHSQEDLQEFLKEAEIMKNFDHDNVVKLLGVTLEREEEHPLPVPMVIMPYMKHRDLRRFLIATRYGDIPMFVPHQSLLRFMMDIAAGMDYLNSQGFVHRDLAARNCMLGDDLRVCVADFGLSKRIDIGNYYRQKVAIRLPIKWMSMESLSESLYTSKSDVWSFGVTMWEIVSRGRVPYPGVHNHELLDLLQSGYRLKPPEDCDHKLYQVMRSCWDQDPAHRPGFRMLHQDLGDLLAQLPVLEANVEASYINQGLQAAAVTLQDFQSDPESRGGNVYQPCPVGATAAAAAAEDGDTEGGYLRFGTGSADHLEHDL
ncbi:unnamed protein product [Ophioblennius macclurei]